MEVVYRDTVRTKPGEINIASGTLVIIVRHASRAWLRYLSSRQSDLAGVAYLMDDDIPGILGCPALPLRYAVKTAARYLIIRSLLGALCHDIWVATPYLQQKYRSVPTRVVPPLYVGPLGACRT
uniref:Uncharacterized protein n=1 Tax=Candidatus Kentrum sp. DK TaxID=2126562 RepID=A0A450TFE4_9GAMM|nr:MAG: hypothetical protein BECKDK2373C_GA0170839_11376 [Candidatus Kentron sp. DK]